MDRQRLLVKMGQLEQYMNELKEVVPEQEEKYLNSTLHKRAVERILQMSIETAIDICAILIQHLKLGPPNNEDNILDLLKDKIPSIEILKAMKRFRNVLVHKYGTIEDKIVYENASSRSGDFSQFLDDVRKILE
jgi:uncharacterized protein YutE (UPF0331/DUF86 family)